jgi:hypothetical protein
MTKDFLNNLGKVSLANSVDPKWLSKKRNKLRKEEYICELKVPNLWELVKDD